MAPEIPDDDLADTRAALAPTLAATAAVLPWLDQQRPPRFAAELNERWVSACRELAMAWSARPAVGSGSVRQAVFALYGVALDSKDADCLALGEALASATDRLDDEPPTAHLVAAMSAAIECFVETSGLEHEVFPQRARHFARRLLNAVERPGNQQRSPLIDRLFASEVRERLTLMHEALDALPPDAVMLKSEAMQIAEQSELIELYGVMDLARQIAGQIDGSTDLDQAASRAAIGSALDRLAAAIAALDDL